MRKWVKFLLPRAGVAGVGMLLWGAAGLSLAEPRIQAVSSSIQGGTEVVKIDLSEPLAAVPAGFLVQSPARIALDFPGVGSDVQRSMIELKHGNLRGAQVVQAADRTRVVLSLQQPANYRAEVQGNSVLVSLDQVVTAPAAAAAPARTFAESGNVDALPLRDIDFRRGADSTGRVVVDLANNQVGVDIRQQGQNLVVEFLRTSLPEGLRRKLDVSDFGTPVQTITTVQSGDRVRMVIEPRGLWEHSAYQSDNQLVVEVRQQKVSADKLTQGPGYRGEKLSLNFQNIDVRSLLQVIADFTNFNIVTSDTVQGNLTLRLKDVPWDQALDIILQSKSLGMKRHGNVLQIAPKDELAAKEKVELESKAQVAQLEPLRTQSFQLNYAKAEEVAKGLSGQGQSGGGSGTKILSPRGSVIFETRTNQLFVSDIPSKLEEIQMLIGKIDVPVRQVLIEARIVIADDNFSRSLGAKLGATDLRGLRGGVPGWKVSGDTRVSIGGNMNAVGGQTLQTDTLNFSDTSFVSLPAIGQNNYNPASFALSLFGASSNRFLNLEISAIEADGRGKVVSSPRVVTADQTKALIEQGTELPYQVATSSGATSLQFRKANLKLEVTPQITPEGSVILDVDVNKDSVGQATAAGFAIDTKHVKTQVLVENGGTVVIGGIFEQSDRTDTTKVPFLGDIPVLGNLFKTTTKTSERTELLIFLTPKVVTDRNGSL